MTGVAKKAFCTGNMALMACLQITHAVFRLSKSNVTNVITCFLVCNSSLGSDFLRPERNHRYYAESRYAN